MESPPAWRPKRMSVEFMQAVLTKRHCCPMVVERVLRLNPMGFDQGTIPRGWNRRLSPARCRGAIGKRQFIAIFGRAAWEAIPDACLYRQGRRVYVHREAVEDRLWLVGPDDPLRTGE